jgi:hypothetical protein
MSHFASNESYRVFHAFEQSEHIDSISYEECVRAMVQEITGAFRRTLHKREESSDSYSDSKIILDVHILWVALMTKGMREISNWLITRLPIAAEEKAPLVITLQDAPPQ